MYKCLFCEKIFKHHCSLTRHVKVHTREKYYNCTVCDEGFLTMAAQKSHERTHLGEKSLKCHICAKSFGSRSSLQPYSCDLWGKGFKQLEHLNVHIRRHLGEKLFKCDVCRKAFVTSFGLRSHFHRHKTFYAGTTRRRPLVRRFVRQRFISEAMLRSHIPPNSIVPSSNLAFL
ncbi:putative zinc finger protein [Orchesella cincta]|uniref:Putative zinc finger protein n=1 Tax=Orchesella cincta TaxID=48709 RepID=A0A1D2M7M9_ORCCI|nr:putative zinc finger protein [Orchesella cincta]